MASIVDFRSRPDCAQLVNAELVVDGRDRTPVDTIEIGDAGALFRTAGDARFVVPLGDVVDVVISLARSDSTFTLQAKIIGRQETGEFRVYHLRWDRGRREELGRELRRIFNSRASVRVRPDPRVPVSLKLCGRDGRAVPARLFDISTSGMAVIAGTDADNVLASCQRVVIAISFPGGTGPVSLEAAILGRKLEASGVHYRLSITTAPGTNPPAENAILDYVMSRQQNLLHKIR